MNYQLTILISNKLDEKARQGVLDAVAKDLGDKAKSDLWGVRGLAYPIKHEEKAFYAHMNFEAEPAAIPVIDRRLKLNEDIIRYLLIKVEAKDLAKTESKPAANTEKAESKEEAAETEENEESEQIEESTEENSETAEEK